MAAALQIIWFRSQDTDPFPSLHGDTEGPRAVQTQPLGKTFPVYTSCCLTLGLEIHKCRTLLCLRVMFWDTYLPPQTGMNNRAEAEADGSMPATSPDLPSGVSYGEVGCRGSLEPEAPGSGACFGCFKIWFKCMNKNINSGNRSKHRGKGTEPLHITTGSSRDCFSYKMSSTGVFSTCCL